MNKFTTLALVAVGIVGMASACSVDASMTDEDIAALEGAACDNPQATNAAMAALAVATAKELKRWEPEFDFRVNKSTSKYFLELTPTGSARCAGGNCRNVKAILSMQHDVAAGAMIGGVALDPGSFRERLMTYLERQVVCNNRIDNHRGDDCPTEAHQLKFSSVTPGPCDSDFWFHASKPNSTASLQYPAQLKNQLLWVGYPDNPYLAFDVQGDDVKIDPTGGLIEGDTTTSGACAVACTKYSATSLIGQCCSCNGLTKKFARSSFSYDYYLCK